MTAQRHGEAGAESGRTVLPSAPAQGRHGPIPLDFHLASAAAHYLSGAAAMLAAPALPAAWHPDLAEEGHRIASEIRDRTAEEGGMAGLARAACRVAADRMTSFLDGIEAYRRHPYRRSLADPPVLSRHGTTRILDYGRGQGRPAVLVIPSLVNRAYILDLSAERSLMRFLAAQGLRPFLVDWGEPGEAERRYSLTDYVAGRLEAVLADVVAAAGGAVALLGYCMGGTLAVALAQRRPAEITRLALLAAPWDFAAGGGARRLLDPAISGDGDADAAGGLLGPVLETYGVLPVNLLQAFFAALDPNLAERKFRGFARLDPESAAARDFVALEDWLNDGVPLAGPSARDCLVGWYLENEPARGAWRIADRVVDPASLRMPALVMIPAGDRIVPPASAWALARRLPAAMVREPRAGHVGMVVGSRARDAVWRPLAAFLAGDDR